MKKTFALLALVAALALGAACSAGGLSGAGDSAGVGPASLDESEQDVASLGDRAGVDVAREEGGDDGRARPAAQTRAVISKGSVSLRTDDVTAARFDVLEVMDGHDGEVSDEETATGDDAELSHSRLVLRVPSARFGDAMAELGEVAELESSSRSSEDVTTEVIDTEARIRAQEQSLRRVEALLAQARDLRDIVAIETQLTQRQADLDSLKSQQAWLTDQTSLSRIVVHLELETTTERRDEQGGFLAGLRDGWGALTAFVSGAARLTGVLLPFAALLALVGVPAWLAARTVRRHRAAPTAEEPAQPTG